MSPYYKDSFEVNVDANKNVKSDSYIVIYIIYL